MTALIRARSEIDLCFLYLGLLDGCKMCEEKWVEKAYRSGAIGIRVTRQCSEGHLTLTFDIGTDKPCWLHWGLRRHRERNWHLPPPPVWPQQTSAFDHHAARSPLVPSTSGRSTLTLRLDRPLLWNALPFVLYMPEERRWIKHGKDDFCVELPAEGPAPSPVAALAVRIGGGDWCRQTFQLGAGERLATATVTTEAGTEMIFVTGLDAPLWLHWGLVGSCGGGWQMPPSAMWPAGSRNFHSKALQTPFQDRDGLRWLEMDFGKSNVSPAIQFVLYAPSQERWIKADGGDMELRLYGVSPDKKLLPSVGFEQLAQRIVAAETGRKSWTLMHRFNLCHELMEGVEQNDEALVLLYTWLRYSAIRQLDWQRRYNTKPRELARAQDRLTLRLAGICKAYPTSRPTVRLMLTTLGPGGDGQRVRDEILSIMHRHHIHEAHGTFVEEWHQKLHNNTTPDDVVICEAYLAFLHADGELDAFYRVLERGGVTRERLANFERPIKTAPRFYGDKKQGLVADFQGFLRLLRSVHSGTDMESAIAAVDGRLDARTRRRLSRLRGEAPVAEALPRWAVLLTGTRGLLAHSIETTEEAPALRDMLYLDLALEQALRAAIERQSLRDVDLRMLISLAAAILHNIVLSFSETEFAFVARQLESLAGAERQDDDWALQVKSVTDRAARAIGDWSDALYGRLQPKAELLGEALGVAKWTIALFSEEVIRGNLPFVLSALLRWLDPMLRARSGTGGWQIISSARAAGRVCVLKSLRSAQGKRYPEPTALLSDRVAGDEEIPEGVSCVITSDTPDLVSHVAVRARNAHVLFATCYDEATYEQLKALDHHRLSFSVSAAGDVDIEEADEDLPGEASAHQKPQVAVRRRPFFDWAIPSAAFSGELVGGKSINLADLQGRLSSWIRFPKSIAVPFGAFEQILGWAENLPLAKRYEQLLDKLTLEPERQLPKLREALRELKAPGVFRDALGERWKQAGLPENEWSSIWRALCRVWASKWNERAYYSRTALNIAHEDLMLAVLIQQVVRAEYAFVIHTVNPLTGAADELFAEVVVGMGETLVGNYPGRAMGFTCQKGSLALSPVSYPSKSVALDADGVIFRSDSNGEDLEGFAGAGLYDSFLVEAPRERIVDYCDDPLVCDQGFRQHLLGNIARLGSEIEQTLGAPQDIEGAVQRGEYYVVQTRPQVGL
jgi:alpha-glucan,water dikinase